MSAQPPERLSTPAEVRDAPLHIVLVEPQIPPNTGNVARLCAATGCALHLVGPLGFSIEDRDLKRAGLDYWHLLRVVSHDSLDAFLASMSPERMWFVSTRGRTRYDRAAYKHGDAVVFGKETAGLPADLLERYPLHTVRIPMRADSVRSLNLATSVGIMVYAALAHLDFPELT